MKKRLFSLFLAVLMICTLLPTSALAAQYNTSVALADLAPGDMVAVGTEITGLTNGLSVLYFSCDQVFFVDKNYSGASCIVEGAVVNSSNTASIGTPENGYWRVGSVDASNLSLVSTDQIYPPLYFYTFHPNVLEITISTNPTNSWPTGMQKAGYTWFGWALLDGTPVTQSYAQTTQGYEDIFGRWTNNSTGELYPAIHSISFDYNDGATAAITRNTSLRGGVMGWPATPSREGYTFLGWEDANGNMYGSGAQFTADAALTAKWTEGTVAPTYQITFDYNDGATASVVLTTDASGKIANWPETPTREGYTFIAWADSKGDHKTDSAVFTETTTLTALWREASSAPQEHVALTFYDSDNTLVAVHRIPKGTAHDNYPDVNVEGYKFLGWSLVAGDPTSIIPTSTVFTQDTDLYAILEEQNFVIGLGASIHDGKIVDLPELPDGFKYMYATLSVGDSYNEKVLTEDDLAALTDEMKSIIGQDVSETKLDKTSHDNIYSDLTDSTVVDNEEPFALIIIHTDDVASSDGSRYVYSIFAEVIGGNPPSQENVSVKFFVDGNQEGEHGIPKGTAIDGYPSADKDGFIFIGWALDANDPQSIIADDYIFNTDTNLYAIFEEEPNGGGSTTHVSIKFFVDNEQIAEHGIPKGTAIDEYPGAHKNGFVFIGWALDANDPQSIIADDYIFNTDTNLYAIFEEEPNGGGSTTHVSIKFFVDNEQIAEHGIPKGTAIEEFPVVNMPGYVFCGWATTKDDPKTTIDPAQVFEEDTNLYAIFEEDPNAGEVQNPVIEIGVSVHDGKIVDLPAEVEDLKFMYLALSVGDTFNGKTVTYEDLVELADSMNALIGTEITDAILDEETHMLFSDVTASTVIDKVEPFVLIVIHTDEAAHEDGNRFVYSLCARIFEEPFEVQYPIVAMDAAVEDGKIVGLPGLGDGLKFIYIALAEGDELDGMVLTKNELLFIVNDMNDMVGMDISQCTIGQEEHNTTFKALTDSTVLDYDGEFALVVLAVDENADVNGERRIFGVFADMVENTVVPGEIEDTTPTTNTGGAKLNNTTAELQAAVPFTAEELEAIENGEDVQIWLEVTDITNTVSETDKTLVNSKKSTYTVGMYIDASMFKQVGDNEEDKLSELEKKVTITITLPDSLINKNANLFRSYRIIRVHNGVAETITPKFDEKTKTLSFETDRFSTYAIAYKDGTVPKTGDTNDVFLWSTLLALSLGALVVVNKKRKEN